MSLLRAYKQLFYLSRPFSLMGRYQRILLLLQSKGISELPENKIIPSSLKRDYF
uniref:Uncharacterized protein n=1 Tax=Octopus bimaculoides TaxID=37653 RepID=A0A0L8GN19_OCTBM